MARQLTASMLLSLLCSGCYLLKSAAVEETCEDTPDGCGSSPTATNEDADGDGYTAEDGDCDDGDAEVYPGAEEVPDDGIDQDCDGSDGLSGQVDADSDGFSAEDDCNDDDAAVNPSATETCDGIDNDCDGLVDDEDSRVEDTTTWFADADNDGYGAVLTGVDACAAPESYVEDNTDCDDSSDAVNPGATEICNSGIDENCNGSADSCPWSGVIAPASGQGIWEFTPGTFPSLGFDMEDVTGDGYPDCLIGLPSSPDWPNGAAVIMSQLPTGVVPVNGSRASEMLIGSSPLLSFGRTVNGVADVTGDSYSDLIVSNGNGETYLFSGPVVSGWQDSADTRLYNLDQTYETKGTLSTDFNNDGYGDLAMGFSEAYSDDSSIQVGRFVITAGPIEPGFRDLTGRSTALDIRGPEENGLFGFASLAEDFDGDGIDEIAISAPFATLDGTYGGVVTIYDDVAGTVAWGDASTFLLGTPDAAFGGELAASDMDGDGLIDLAVGAPYEQPDPSAMGAAHVFTDYSGLSVPSESAWATVVGTRSEAMFGYAIELGETDGMSGTGIVIGAPTSLSEDSGVVVGFHSLTSGTYLSTDGDFAIAGATATAGLGYDMTLIDANNDGIDDIFTMTSGNTGVGFYPMSGL